MCGMICGNREVPEYSGEVYEEKIVTEHHYYDAPPPQYDPNMPPP